MFMFINATYNLIQNPERFHEKLRRITQHYDNTKLFPTAIARHSSAKRTDGRTDSADASPMNSLLNDFEIYCCK